MSNNYSKKLKELRGSKSQQETADAIGIVRETYASYETGRRFPNPEGMSKIAKFYNMTVDEIFFNIKCDE